jgi:hypothetical protein
MKLLNDTISIRNQFDFLDSIWYSANMTMCKTLRIRRAGEVFTVREQIVDAV